MKKLILSFTLIVLWGTLFSQTLIVTDDPAYTTGNASSVLDVKSSLKGFLAPRMLQSGRLAISSPADGLLVYQTDGIKGFYYYNGLIWIIVSSGSNSNYLPLAGGTMTGELTTVASSTTNAGLNLPHGVAPSTPVNGDLWSTTIGIFARINGSTVGPLGTGTGNGSVTSITATSPLTGGTITTTGSIGITQANGSTNGYLSSGDWTAFNNKVSSQWTTSGSNIYYNTGNVGIGNANPTSLFSTGPNSEFQVNSTGNIIKLNNVVTSFPSSQGAASSYLMNDGTGALSWATGLGSVTSVGLAMPLEFTVTNSPVTTSGTLTAGWSSQAQNLVFSSPAAASGTPQFRSLTANDLPSIPWSKITTTPTTLSGYGITDALPLAGGTMTGKLNTFVSTSATAGLNLGAGTAPTTPVNGDLWATTAGVYARINSSTLGPFGTGNGSVTSITATSPLTGGTITTTGSIGIGQANSTTNGYLSSGDWTTFNNKVSSQWTTSGSSISYSTGSVGIGTTTPGTMLDVHGSFSLPITTVTANYTVGANDYTVLCNNSVSITITLPTAAGISGRIIVIKKLTATSTTIDGYGSETIDGATTVVSTTQWLSWMLQSNGTAWFVISTK